MKLFILKNKSCFQDKQPYYGEAGDAFISAIIAAETKNKALDILYKEMDEDYRYDWETYDKYKKSQIIKRRNFKKNWTIEELIMPKTKQILLLNYGLY